MDYRHFEIVTASAKKKNKNVCGDVILVERNSYSTIAILCDGLGSGVKANLAASVCGNRILQLLKEGFSIREVFLKLVKTMEEARLKELPYSVFSILRILDDGMATVLSYEMPFPVFIGETEADILEGNVCSAGYLNYESEFKIGDNEALLMMSDGITNSGIGKRLRNGWQANGVKSEINHQLRSGTAKKDLPSKIVNTAKLNWEGVLEDDCTAVIAFPRKGLAVNLMTGPPEDKAKDQVFADDFLNEPGLKIICGASTAKIVARETGKDLKIDANFTNVITPPDYQLDGIDLVTEGAVTLNQLYNVWDEDHERLEKDNPVTELTRLLYVADKINLFAGKAVNPAVKDISFKQTGIVSRQKILKLLIEKFRESGKLVNVRYY